MPQVQVVQLKDNWSIECKDPAQYAGMKAMLQFLGYTFEQSDSYSAFYPLVTSSDVFEGGVTQGRVEEEYHFETVLDFLVFHFNAQDDFLDALNAKRAELDEIDAQLMLLAA